MKKLSLLLSILLICTLIFSCSENQQSEQNAPVNDLPPDAGDIVEVEVELSDNLPDELDFGGQAINIAQRIWDRSWPCCKEFIAEEETGDILNDAVFRRNRAVEERLNVDINFVGVDVNQFPAAMRATIAAGDNAYDLMAGAAGNIGGLALEGLFMNLKDVPHLDLEKPWWNQQIVSGATIGDKLHLISGDANLSVLMSSMLLFVNKELMIEHGLPDVYDVVIEGRWTLDELNNYVRGFYSDLNGDGIMDENDLFGFIFPHDNFINAFMESAGVRVISTGNDGVPYFDMSADRLAALVDQVIELLYDNPASSRFPEGPDAQMFANNQVLFIPYAMQDAEYYWRDMEADFGMIPYPKLDESQERYYSSVWDGHTLFSIPANSSTVEMTGAVMEALSSESYRTTVPTYFDIVMKVKTVRDERTEQMLDIIRGGAFIDFSTIFKGQIHNPWGALMNTTRNGINTVGSWYESNGQRIQAAIEDIIERVGH